MSREDGTMQIFSSYKVRIAESNQKISRGFIDTLELYRRASDYFIERIREHWGSVFVQEMPEYKQIKATEELCVFGQRTGRIRLMICQENFPSFPAICDARPLVTPTERFRRT